MSRRASSSRCWRQIRIAIACACAARLRAQLQRQALAGRARRRRAAPCSAASSARNAGARAIPRAPPDRRFGAGARRSPPADRRGSRPRRANRSVPSSAAASSATEPHASELRRAGGPAAISAPALAVLRLEVVAVGALAAGDRGLADAVEVLAFGAVLPVLALGGAELGRIQAGGVVARASPAPLSARVSASSRSPSRSPAAARSVPGGVSGVEASSSASRKGFCSSICSTSCWSSSVDSCSRRIDCCSCGVSDRCCDRRTCRDGFDCAEPMRMAATCGNVRRGRPCARRRCSTISPGVPSASTLPSLMM